MKSHLSVATLLCCLIAVAPQVFAQVPSPPVTPTPAETRPKSEPPVAPSKTVAPQANASQQRARNPRAELQLKIFQLQHIKAADAEQTISQLFLPDLASLAADQRSNALIVRGDPERLAEIEALLMRLDAVPAKNAIPYGRQGVPGKPAIGAVQIPLRRGGANYPQRASADGTPATKGGNTFMSRAVAPGQIAQGETNDEGVETLRRRFKKLDEQCMTIARQLREVEGQGRKQDQQPDRLKKLGSDLRSAVSDAFQARQQLQRAELAAFLRRMQQTSDSIELRDRIADEIITRRVEDLLNPNRQWDNRPTVDPSRLGNNAAPRDSKVLTEGTTSLAGSVESDVAHREKTRTQIQGKWVLARTRNDPKPQTLTMESNALHLFDAGSKVVRTGTVRLNTPREGHIVVEFGKDRFPRITWMGSFEVSDDQFTVRFDSANVTGANADFSMATEEETLWHWSGVYRRATAEAVNPLSQDDTANPLAKALQPVLAILRGDDSEQARLARTYFDDEWTDDIARILACQGHEQLLIAQASSDDKTVFVITSAVKNNNGHNMIGELVFSRQADGTWKLALIDVEPADNAKRDMDRFRKDHPDAQPLQIPNHNGDPAVRDETSVGSSTQSPN